MVDIPSYGTNQTNTANHAMITWPDLRLQLQPTPDEVVTNTMSINYHKLL
jgi:hypothetical protein